MQIFLIVSTGFLYLVAAGLFSKGVWALEMHKVGKLRDTEAGSSNGYASGIKLSVEMRQRLVQAQGHTTFARAFGTSM